MHKVSIIIPCYNQAHYLAEAVESCLAQEGGETEVLIVNDGSTDATEAVALELAAKAPDRIRYHHQENQGLAMARQAGLDRATSEFVILLDADDALAPVMVREASRAFAAHPASDAVAGDALMLSADMKTPIRTLKPNLPIRWENAVRFNPIGACNAVMLRREAALGVGGFAIPGVRRCEDWDFWLRMIRAGKRFHYVPATFAYYRQHTSALSEDPLAMLEEKLKLLARLAAPDPRIATGAAQEQPVLTEAERAQLQSEYVFHALGSAVGRERPSPEIDAILSHLGEPGGLRRCCDAFLYGLQHSLQVLGRRGVSSGGYVDEVMARISDALAGGGREGGKWTAELRRLIRQPFRRFSIRRRWGRLFGR